MSAEYINIGGVQFRPASFIDMDKKQFVTYYAGKINHDINEAWDILQDHIKPLKKEQVSEFKARSSSKVKRK